MNNYEIAIHQAQPQFQAIATNHNMVKWAEESQFAMQALQKNASLQKCVPATIQDSIINVAAVGLTLNPADGYAYLVPEYNKNTKQSECQLRISFKGLIKIATDTGSIKWVKAEIVRANDTFSYRGPTETPEHTMDPFSGRGEIVGVYCIAKTVEDDILVDVMAKGEIDQIRSCAKTDFVWKSWYGEMAKKAIIKRAQKQWPKTQKSSVLHNAIDVMNKHEGSEVELDHIEETAAYIIEKIEADDQMAVGEAWCELSEREMSIMWTAKTKGGYFTQAEKEYLRAAESAYKKANLETA